MYYPPEYAIDGKPDTYWLSTDIESPYIQLVLNESRRICRVDITWVGGEVHYIFNIAASMDGNKFTYVFAGSGEGVTGLSLNTKPEIYTFPDVTAKYVKIIMLLSNLAQQNKVAIAEITLFGN